MNMEAYVVPAGGNITLYYFEYRDQLWYLDSKNWNIQRSDFPSIALVHNYSSWGGPLTELPEEVLQKIAEFCL